MLITQTTLDDLMHSVIKDLFRSKTRINPTRGPATELNGVLLCLKNPRARLSRTEMKGKLFSALGELLWYLAGTKDLDFIAYYVSRYRKESDDGRTVYGGYGPRLFKMRSRHNQIKNVLRLLTNKPDSRRAVIQLFDAADISQQHKEIPCTCSLQFMIRHDRLHMFTTMRSNDAFVGLPHDVFAFTMLQEIFARTLGVEMGAYKHSVGSLHLYDSDRQNAQRYLAEGYQPRIKPMPTMPLGDPWTSLRKLVRAERRIRDGATIDIDALGIEPYWADLARLLQVYHHFKKRRAAQVATLKARMSIQLYDLYIDDKLEALNKRRTAKQRERPQHVRAR